MTKLRLFLHGFWDGFLFNDSLLGLALADRYNVQYVTSPAECDVSIESYFIKSKKKYWPLRFAALSIDEILDSKGVRRIFFSGEPHAIPVGKYHGIISHEPWLGELSFRLPLWVLYCRLFGENAQVTSAKGESGYTRDQLMSPIYPGKRPRFACAIFGNPHHARLDAIRKLSAFGQVDIFGTWSGRLVADKMDIMRQYRFNICYENTITPGYITEKALQAKMAGCIPLWWGDPTYRLDFSEKALVNAYEYEADFSRIFNTVDFNEIIATPLITSEISNYRSSLASFYEQIINGDSKRFGLPTAF